MVYIVLINYRNSNDTEECLLSLLNSSYNNYRIVIIDNSVTEEPYNQLIRFAENKLLGLDYSFIEDESIDTNRSNFNHALTFVKSNFNAGFAAANNIAIRYLLNLDDCRFIWLLNNDTTVDRQALGNLVKFADKYPENGMIGSLIMEYYDPSEIQIVSGIYCPLLARPNSYKGEKKQYAEKNNIPIDYIPGASMFVSKRFVEDIGLMNEHFFLYFEELDWAIRGKKKGWKMNVCLTALVYHKGGQSINGNNQNVSKTSIFYGLRNRILFTKLYYASYLPFLFLLYIFILFYSLLTGKTIKAKYTLLLIPFFFKSASSISKLKLI